VRLDEGVMATFCGFSTRRTEGTLVDALERARVFFHERTRPIGSAQSLSPS